MWVGSTELVEGLPQDLPQRNSAPSRKGQSLTLALYQLCDFALGQAPAPDNVLLCTRAQLIDVGGGVTWCVADKRPTDEDFLGQIGQGWQHQGSQLDFFGDTAITRTELVRQLSGSGREPQRIIWTITWRQGRRRGLLTSHPWEVVNSHASFVAQAK